MIATEKKIMSPDEVKSAFYGPSTQAPDNSPRALRLRRVNAAREMLIRKGYTAASPVFVTSSEFLDDSDLAEVRGPNQNPPQVFEVIGHYAAYLLADRTHRISTDDEIHRFRQEQIEREELCAKIESKNPNNKHVHQTVTYNVLSPDGKTIQAASPAATAEAPARLSRNSGAGDNKDK